MDLKGAHEFCTGLSYFVHIINNVDNNNNDNNNNNSNNNDMGEGK